MKYNSNVRQLLCSLLQTFYQLLCRCLVQEAICIIRSLKDLGYSLATLYKF